MARLRRGVSLEVIVEEDDGTSPSPSPLSEESGALTTDSNSSSPTPDDYKNDKRRTRHQVAQADFRGTRARSVSCEALTVLDASDLETCEAEWNDGSDGDEGGMGRPVCVTFSGPISRRKILKARQALHDDMEFEEYQVADNENLYFEQTLALYDNVQNMKEQRQEIQMKEEEEMEFNKKETNIDDDLVSTQDEDESLPDTQFSPREIPDIIIEEPVDEEISYEDDSTALATDDEQVFSGDESSQVTVEDEHTNIEIIEFNTNDSSDFHKSPTPDGESNTLEQQKRQAYTIRNKEVSLAELPAPHTVSVVKRLFEDLSTRTNYRTYKTTGRFKGIRSNPSSKILRFDRHQPFEHISFHTVTLQDTKPVNSSIINKTNITQLHNREKITTTNQPSETITKPVTKTTEKTAWKPTKRTPKTDSHIPLRKPKIVSGFNVRKALQEDPRNYHMKSIDTKQSVKKVSKINTTSTTNYNKFHKPPKEILIRDNDEVESLSSDTSEDSGVSTSSSSCGPPFRIRGPVNRKHVPHEDDEDNSSFKWIDPSVLARIRAVGTTVIFFGPRQKGKGLGDTPPVHPVKKPTTTPLTAQQKTQPTQITNIPKLRCGQGRAGDGRDNTVVYNFTKHNNPTSTHLPEII